MESFCSRRASHGLASARTPAYCMLQCQSRALRARSMNSCGDRPRNLQPLQAAQTAEAAQKAEEYNRSMSS